MDRWQCISEESRWLHSPSSRYPSRHSSSMVGLTLFFLAAVCVLSSGVWLWAICTHFFTESVPAGIGHPVKMRVLSCLLQLLVTWVSFLYCSWGKLGLCRFQVTGQQQDRQNNPS